MKRICWSIISVITGLNVCIASAADSSTVVQPFAAVPSAERLSHPFGGEDQATFEKPDKIFGPESWFHFIGGNVADKGITADLEAVAGAGIAGIQLFHGQFGGPWPGVEPQIKCLTESWDDSVRHAALECRRLGLRFTMQNCPGWAMAGGPWIEPGNAMRHLVWSRTDVTGGDSVKIQLPQPQPSQEEWRDYREVAVIAFPVPEGDTGKALEPLTCRSNRSDLPWDKCLKNQPDGKIRLEPGSEPVWVEVTFDGRVTLRTLELPPVEKMSHSWCYDPGVTVTVEAVLPEGLRQVAKMDMPPSNWQDDKPVSMACSEVASTTYRITINNLHTMALNSMQLFSAARKNNWEAEAAWVLRGLDRQPHPQQSRSAWIDRKNILDITDRMNEKGVLQWKPPAGRWTVMRWGHVNTGRRNGPAPKEATGWECDKLSPKGAEAHFAGYIGRLCGKDGPVKEGLLQGMLMDSWECQTQTWTPEMAEEFARMRGYPLLPWFPALAGYVIDDPETTTRFLRDWRSTINTMLVENFFGRMAQLGHRNNLAISFETASGDVFPGDILEYYKYADVPMCEFWHPRMDSYVGSFEFKPVKSCVSAARLYGKPRVAAEAFTSFNLSWTEHPGMLKHVANMHLAEGVTHLVFHTYTHNPRTDFLQPGTAFGSGIGTPFLRGQSWWNHMPEFTAYLARCGFLLERGQPVSDVLWYLGDEQDHKPRQSAPFPAGYRYDYCNPDILLNRLSVRDGCLVTPEGISYHILWLPDCRRMLPETLERMVELVKKGAVLVGEPPAGVATLSGGAESQKRFDKAVAELWGSKDEKPGVFSKMLSGRKPEAAGVRKVGRGRVIPGMPLEEALRQQRIEPDLTGEGVVWSHRQVEGADWYFVAAPLKQGFNGTLRFRSTGKVELWNPQTGEVSPAGIVRYDGNGTLVALNIPPSAAVFVLFNGDQNPQSAVVRVEHNGECIADAGAPHAADFVVREEVLSASYGDPKNNERRIDVAEKIRSALARGETEVRPGNGWAGGDPALGTPKRLFVSLRLPDGSEKKLEARENQALELTESRIEPLPVCEIMDGGKRLLAWEPGRYSIRRADDKPVGFESRLARRISLSGPWKLSFPPGWGAPESVEIPQLLSWTGLEMPPEAKAFSGTALYSTEFTLDKLPDNGGVMIDLGDVAVIARVRVNGKPVGTVWSVPYRLDISTAAKAGINRLEVEVTSTWFNRLAYDAGLPEAERKTWTIKGPGKGSALKPAGLIGPVTICVGESFPFR